MNDKSNILFIWFRKNWIVPTLILCSVILLYFAVELKPYSLLSFFLIAGFVCVSIWFPLKTQRPWLIPMFLLLPAICIPGTIALASLSSKFSYSIMNHCSPAYNLPMNVHHICFLLNICMIVALAVWCIWVAYICWRGTDPRHSLIRFFNILLISLVFWCLALGMQTIRTSNAIKQASALVDLKIIPQKTAGGKELRTYLQKIDQMEKELLQKYPDFIQPAYDIYSWTDSDKYSKKEYEKKRTKLSRKTLSRQEPPEVSRYFALLDDTVSLLPFSGEDVCYRKNDYSFLNSLRSCARHQVRRAQIAHDQGRMKDILPQLEKIIPFDAALAGSSILISELIRCSIFSMQYANIVFLAPTGPEYTETYRKMLKYAENWQISAPSGIKPYILSAQHKLQYICKPSEFLFVTDFNFSFFPALLLRPLELHLESTVLKNAMILHTLIPKINRMTRFPPNNANSEIYAALIQSLKMNKISGFDWKNVVFNPESGNGIVFVNPYDSFSLPADMIKVFAKLKSAKALAITGTALKLYKSLYGKYPDSLNKLVPEILNDLPNDPYTGKPFQYIVTNGEFELKSAKKILSGSSKVLP